MYDVEAELSNGGIFKLPFERFLVENSIWKKKVELQSTTKTKAIKISRCLWYNFEA